jgi:hypothetical protein
MKQRKPNDFAEKPDKPLCVRYFEVVELRELVKKSQLVAGDETKSSDKSHTSIFNDRR